MPFLVESRFKFSSSIKVLHHITTPKNTFTIAKKIIVIVLSFCLFNVNKIVLNIMFLLSSHLDCIWQLDIT